MQVSPKDGGARVCLGLSVPVSPWVLQRVCLCAGLRACWSLHGYERVYVGGGEGGFPVREGVLIPGQITSPGIQTPALLLNDFESGLFQMLGLSFPFVKSWAAPS